MLVENVLKICCTSEVLVFAMSRMLLVESQIQNSVPGRLKFSKIHEF